MAVPAPSAPSAVGGGVPASAAAVPSLAPSPVVPTFSPLPPVTTVPTTTPPTTRTPTPSPSPSPALSRAPKCTGEPTGTQIITLVKRRPGIPDKPLRLQDGPFCSGQWSYATLELAGAGPDQLEPLMVVATGKGSTLALVAAGTYVCNTQVQADAPVGIRVLACGF